MPESVSGEKKRFKYLISKLLHNAFQRGDFTTDFNFGPLFRPNWRVSLLVSSLIFTVSRTFLIYYIEERTLSQMAATAVFSFNISALAASFAYIVRWVLVVSFVF